eukprot:IDg3132t1
MLGLRHEHSQDGTEILLAEDTRHGPQSMLWGERNPLSVMACYCGQLQRSNIDDVPAAFDHLSDGCTLTGPGRFGVLTKIVCMLYTDKALWETKLNAYLRLSLLRTAKKKPSLSNFKDRDLASLPNYRAIYLAQWLQKRIRNVLRFSQLQAPPDMSSMLPNALSNEKPKGSSQKSTKSGGPRSKKKTSSHGTSKKK